MTMVGNWHII